MLRGRERSLYFFGLLERGFGIAAFFFCFRLCIVIECMTDAFIGRYNPHHRVREVRWIADNFLGGGGGISDDGS